jgi:peptidoglycan L-alanyl-D-glutamate endopeptidase CwlK
VYKYSQRSLAKLKTCHPLLQEVFMEAIKHYDITILEGIRTLEQQKQYFNNGKTRTLNSKHLKQADGYSHAVDAGFYPIDWQDTNQWYFYAGIIMGIAKSKGIQLRSGADWDSDGTTSDQEFLDAPHVELISTEKLDI